MKKSNPKAPCLAVMGTGSDVGKSIVVTALCRYFANQGFYSFCNVLKLLTEYRTSNIQRRTSNRDDAPLDRF